MANNNNFMKTFFQGHLNSSVPGRGNGQVQNTPWGPFVWNDLLEKWQNVNNGMLMENVQYQNMLYEYETVSGGSPCIFQVNQDYIIGTAEFYVGLDSSGIAGGWPLLRFINNGPTCPVTYQFTRSIYGPTEPEAGAPPFIVASVNGGPRGMIDFPTGNTFAFSNTVITLGPYEYVDFWGNLDEWGIDGGGAWHATFEMFPTNFGTYPQNCVINELVLIESQTEIVPLTFAPTTQDVPNDAGAVVYTTLTPAPFTVIGPRSATNLQWDIIGATPANGIASIRVQKGATGVTTWSRHTNAPFTFLDGNTFTVYANANLIAAEDYNIRIFNASSGNGLTYASNQLTLNITAGSTA